MNFDFTLLPRVLPGVSMALLPLLVLLLCTAADPGSAVLVGDMDFGGVPLWINRLAGEPSVLSLHGRMDRAWLRATNPQACPQQCDCPIQWPTALYCDHRGLERIPDSPSDGTQYLFLQVGRRSASCVSFPTSGLGPGVKFHFIHSQ